VNRRDLLTLLGAAALRPRAARAQQRPMPVIGFLLSGSPDQGATYTAAFRQGLSDAGYVEGQNVAIEYRWAEGRYDRLPGLAADLVGRKVDVIVAGGGTPPVLAAKGATSEIPIVFANLGDPVGQGLVASLARPGGNLTGVSILFSDLASKRVELVAELVPRAREIGLLVNPTNPTNETTFGDVQGAGRAKAVQIHVLKASSETEIDAAFAVLAQLHTGALIVGADPFFYLWRERLIALSSRHAVPAIYAWREFVASGGLVSYGPSITGTYRQAGVYAGKILKGAKPVDLPVEQPTKFELVLNLNTAKALGLAVPPALLARADEVVE
jgi:putative ABC transport system substrate-binding protein